MPVMLRMMSIRKRRELTAISVITRMAGLRGCLIIINRRDLYSMARIKDLNVRPVMTLKVVVISASLLPVRPVITEMMCIAGGLGSFVNNVTLPRNSLISIFDNGVISPGCKKWDFNPKIRIKL